MATGKGGAREGAGRKPKTLDIPPGKDPVDFLMAVMDDATADPKLRVRAAVAAAQYKSTKLHDGGKKEERQRKAKSASEGKFAPAAAPVKAPAVH